MLSLHLVGICGEVAELLGKAQYCRWFRADDPLRGNQA